MPVIDTYDKLVLQANGYGANSRAIYFDGSGDYLSLADHADWDFGTGDFTLECWVRFTVLGQFPVLIDNGGYASGVRMAWYNTNNLNVYIVNTQYNFAWTPLINKWYHVALTRSGSNLKAFINGVQIGSTQTDSSNITGLASGLTVARGSISEITDAYTFNGFMKCVRVSNSARYTANFVPPTSFFSADSNTKLLALAEESVGATTFSDSETTPKAITTNGNSKILLMDDYRSSIFLDSETAGSPKKISDYSGARVITRLFNNTAGFFPGDHSPSGSNPRITVPNHSDWSFGTGDYTVEGWFMFFSTGGNAMLFSRNRNVSAGEWEMDVTGSNISWATTPGGVLLNVSYAIQTLVWYHIAVVRSGTSLKMYVNGVEVGSTTSSGDITGSSADIDIGGDTAGNWGFHGWMKEVRISNSARYTAAFTPSTSPFASDANTKLLLHFDTPATSPLSPCVKFDGAGDYLTLADSNDWDFGTGDFTLECWIKFTLLPNSSGLSPQWFFEVGHYSAHGVGFYVWNNGIYGHMTSAGVTISASFTPVLNRWYHVVMQRSASTLILAVDGVQLASVSNSTNITGSTEGVGVGAEYGSGVGSYFNGFMKSARISNSARYTFPFTPSQTPFAADGNTKLLLLFNENNGATSFLDSETTPKTITTVGDTKIYYEEDYRHTIFKDSGNTGHKPYGLTNKIQKIDFLAPFGSGATWLDGVDDGLDTPDHADFDYGSGDFTVGAWVKFYGTQTSYQTVVGQTINDNSYSVIGAEGGLGNWVFYSTGVVNLNVGGAIQQGIWYFVEWVRSGSNWYLFVNGTLAGSTTGASAWPSYTSKLTVGYEDFNGVISNRYYLNGFMDNVRVSKGIARHTATFNPDARDISDGVSGQMLVFF